MSLRISTFFALLLPSLLLAQVVSTEGRYAVDFDKGCVPFQVNITEIDTAGGDKQYIYFDGAEVTTATSFTYTTSGTFQIVQIVNNLVPQTDTLTVQAFDPTPTNFSTEKCNLSSISVTSEEQVYDFIRVYFTPTDSATLLFGERASFSYGSTSVQTFQTKGFYNEARENCTTFSHDVAPLNMLSTPDILFTSVSETCRDFFALSLEIQNFDPEVRYQIEFEQSNTDVIYEGKIDTTHLVFAGINYSKTHAQYCVKINALDVCSGSVLEGTSTCESITELSSTPFENLYTSYMDGHILVNMDSITSGSLGVYRKLSIDGDFELRADVTGSYMDPIGISSRQYFYRVDYQDSCGQVLFSSETNPPLLSTETLAENSYTITLTDAVNALSGITSSEYQVGNDMTVTEPLISNTFDLRLDPQNGTRQFLQAFLTYNDGTIVNSNELTYRYVPFIHVPKAFTPDGDGLNDTLELFGLPTEAATTNIYNRWSQLIYTSAEPTPGWDGFINGSLAPEGTYLYEIIFNDSDGEKVVQKGTFALIKK